MSASCLRLLHASLSVGQVMGTRRALANVLSLTLAGKPATVTFDSDERLEVVWVRERVGDTEHMPTLVRANDIACCDEMRKC